jgi:hypothetical protein
MKRKVRCRLRIADVGWIFASLSAIFNHFNAGNIRLSGYIFIEKETDRYRAAVGFSLFACPASR